MTNIIGFYSIWPYFIILPIIFALVNTSLFSVADSPPTLAQGRVETLDGLRGILAFSVFFNHAAIYVRYLREGVWILPPSPFYSKLGPISVAGFFMITGYLFWNKLLRCGGRPRWVELYIGRAFRILPLYWFLVVILVLSVCIHSNFHLDVPPSDFLKKIGEWFAGGVLVEVPINGYENTKHITAGVTWTLSYEWKFYASLLLLAPLARYRKLGLLAPIAALIGLIFYMGLLSNRDTYSRTPVYVATFLIGMVTASLMNTRSKPYFGNWTSSLIIISSIALSFSMISEVTTMPSVMALGVAFYLIASGSTIFGLLTTRAAKRMGDISYGIYLLQGPILALTFASRTARALETSSPSWHWTFVLSAAIALLVISTITHDFIERPAVELGKRFVKSGAMAFLA